MRNAVTHRLRNQFMRMAFTQVIVTSFFVLQWIGFYMYYISIEFQNKGAEQWKIIYFVFLLTNTLYYIINVKSFYLSTLTSCLFRETFIKNFLKLIDKLLKQLWDIAPVQPVTNNVL